jgi:MFS family permease
MEKETGSLEYKTKRPGVYYGYIVAIFAFCIIFSTFGIRFSYGVFFNPMSSELGWNSATTSLAFSISMLTEGVFNILLGGLIDKYGPRVIVTICGVIIAAGYCLIPLVNTEWQFFLFYGGIVGIGMGGMFVPLISLISRWFTARRGMVTGLVMSSVGIGMLIVTPLANQLIISFGWRNTFLIFGLSILVITTICAQFLKRDPSTVGMVPYGNENNTSSDQNPNVTGHSLKEALRTYQFWFVFFMLFSYGFCTNSINIHIVPDVIKMGISATIGATILATIGGLQIAGRIGMGLAADRIGNKSIFIMGFSIATLLLFWLPSINEAWVFFIFAVIFGFTQGGSLSLSANSSQAFWPKIARPFIRQLRGRFSHRRCAGTVHHWLPVR